LLEQVFIGLMPYCHPTNIVKALMGLIAPTKNHPLALSDWLTPEGRYQYVAALLCASYTHSMG